MASTEGRAVMLTNVKMYARRSGPKPAPALLLWLRQRDSYANATYGVRSVVRASEPPPMKVVTRES